MAKEILCTSKMCSKFQVTIPIEVRDRFKLEAEEILVFLDAEGSLVVRKNTED